MIDTRRSLPCPDIRSSLYGAHRAFFSAFSEWAARGRCQSRGGAEPFLSALYSAACSQGRSFNYFSATNRQKACQIQRSISTLLTTPVASSPCRTFRDDLYARTYRSSRGQPTALGHDRL